MTKKTLQGWYNGNDINYSQKEIIKKFGVGDYYPQCERRDFLKIWYWNDILYRNTYKLESSFGERPVHQMTFFSTWWNNNLILVVEGSSIYYIKLIVYELKHKGMGEIFEVFCPDIVTSNEGGLSEARNRARSRENNLKGENPIFYVSPHLDVHYNNAYGDVLYPAKFGYYGYGTQEPVKRIEVDYNSARWNPDAYFKPLDIVKRFVGGNRSDRDMVHTCIYLGNRKIAHAYGGSKVEIEDWSDFFNNVNIGSGGEKKMLRYHPVIAFKKPEKIMRHIAKCVESKFYVSSDDFKDEFRVLNDKEKKANNCESFANRCVLGLNFSELADRRDGKSSREIRVKNDPDDNDIPTTNDKLDDLTSSTPWHEVNKIREACQNSGYETFDINRDGIIMEARVEVQPKTSILSDIQKEYIRNIYGK